MIGFQLLGGPHWLPLVYRVSLRGYDAGPAAGVPPAAWPWPAPDPEPESFPVHAATSRHTTETTMAILSLSRIPVPSLFIGTPPWSRAAAAGPGRHRRRGRPPGRAARCGG